MKKILICTLSILFHSSQPEDVLAKDVPTECSIIQDKAFQNAFISVANTDAGCQNQKQCNLHQKWYREIKIKVIETGMVDSSVTKNPFNETMAAIKYFGKILKEKTGIKTSILEIKEKGTNFVVFIVDDIILDYLENNNVSIDWKTFSEYNRILLGEKKCSIQIGASDKEILYAYLFIPRALDDGEYKTCTLGALYKATGLLGYLEGNEAAFGSYFKENSSAVLYNNRTDEFYSDQMKLMLKLYYELDVISEESLNSYFLTHCTRVKSN